MLYRYAGEPDGAADLSAYTDAGSVSAYAEKAVQWCVKNGILTGKTSSTLAPKATATRAKLQFRRQVGTDRGPFQSRPKVPPVG